MRKSFAALCIFAFAGPAQAGGGDGPFNWTGFYVGAHAGYAWGDVEHTQTNGGMPFGPFSYDPAGAFGGATAGYNWQVSNVVVGIEADLGYMDLPGEGRIPSSTPPHYQALTVDGGLYGVIAGRLGFATEHTLIYAKAGWTYLDAEARQQTTKPGFVTHGSDAFSGWVYGGGIEHALGGNWSIKAEYLHFDFGKETGDQTSITDPPVGFVYENATDVTADTFKLGINYSF